MEDIDSIDAMFEGGDDLSANDNDSGNDDPDADWAEDEQNDQEAMTTLGIISETDLENLESPLSIMSLMHGLTITDESYGMMKKTRNDLNNAEDTFRVVRIDTGASTSYIMSLSQYTGY